MPRAVLCIACNCIVHQDGRPFTEGFVFVHFSPLVVVAFDGRLCPDRLNVFSKKTHPRRE
jgi:hypothetical protein